MRKGPVLVVAAVVALLLLSRHARQQTAGLPDLRGMTLRGAQLAARSAGFRQIAAEGALGRHRVPLLSTNWTVCSQRPAPARHSLTTLVTVRVVKTDEACPRQRPTPRAQPP
ncbi:hypothetical protein AQI95_33075 [Streptomyces yokosukanensis]|uniref:PASTA domain-containing protein n=1 Tax=Streptomyces yokosukanensis TaxID=67386 RepID=A0A124HEI3_9ACTN|nr:hypothetical protein [Streptomyces yokosukanensis]KUN00822.1 hypothetical protein AQI95_33075 [Streptomyces yokosukanensis]